MQILEMSLIILIYYLQNKVLDNVWNKQTYNAHTLTRA